MALPWPLQLITPALAPAVHTLCLSHASASPATRLPLPCHNSFMPSAPAFTLSSPLSVQVMLPRLPAEATSVVFSQNFCRTLANNLSKGDTYLHPMAKKVMVGANVLRMNLPWHMAAKLWHFELALETVLCCFITFCC